MYKEYDKILQNLVVSFSQQSKMRNDPALFKYRHGKLYKNGLMICGRAVNGVDSSYKNSTIEKNLADLFTRVNTSLNDIDWIDSSQSRFFNLAKHVALNILCYKNNWYDYIMWTNLMKIAPSNGGNPSDKDWRIQKEACKQLFKMELDYFKPDNLLLITDFNWADEFLQYLGIDSYISMDTKGNHMVKGHYIYRNTNIILGNRPEYRKENRYVSEIAKYIKK